MHISGVERYGAPPLLARLDALDFTQEQIDERRKTLNCSELPLLASGSPNDVNHLFMQKIGDTVARRPRGLNASAGQWMEPWINAQLEDHLGVEVTRCREKVHAPRRPWLAATLDGFCHWRGGSWVVQTKFYHPLYRLDRACQDRHAQVLGESYVAHTDGTLLVIYNQGDRLRVFPFENDAAAVSELLEVAEEFWDCVQQRRLPRVVPPKAKPVRIPAEVRKGEISMHDSNAWMDAAAEWCVTREPHLQHEQATANLKSLMPPDVLRAFGGGVEVTCNKAGSKTVKATVEPTLPKEDE